MADELFLEPDVETAVVAVLFAASVDAVGYRYGAPASAQTQVRKTGGRKLDPAHWEIQITVTSWAASVEGEYLASQDARRSALVLEQAVLAGWLDSVACSRIQVVSSPYPDPDPVTGRARYSATYSFVVRGAAPLVN